MHLLGVSQLLTHPFAMKHWGKNGLFWQTTSSNTLSIKEGYCIVICGPIDIKSSLMREMVRCPQSMNQRWATCCVTRFECVNRATRTRWMNYVPRKMPDVRSRYDRFMIAPIYVRMLRYMDECYGLFTTKANHFHLERQQGKSEGFESCDGL